ncbi:MAG: pyridoxal-dependent decarboxylase [Chloroflexi bacterium]|nr:pyridoxal-dependent decarboxylase [Chloroflexota bacterium]MCY3581794.1 pyridoxal-dependent decarboxylase [Chloroflexota bacterium]MCY3716826.1 pyridoxal-dependent decarboxylase [Chloroflexota bacterium]MDE2649688.1 pyridoxal-dependent decarboxylase [Chloroflexota bacterium]MXX83573.1 aspartate aminotransferase family protein [Chloroflexota bacterium]
MNIGETQALLRQAVEYGCEYLGSLDERPVFPDAVALAALEGFDEPLPGQPTPPGDVLRELQRLGSSATTANAGGRYFGFVNGGALPAALAGRVLADCWDQNAALQQMSPVAAKLEAVCERWLVDLLRLPEQSAVGLVSGTSVASLCGLLAGRNTLLTRAGWNVKQEGLFGAPALRVVMGSSAHATIRKALAILGIGAAQIELVPVDAQGRMNAKALPPLDERSLLVVQAGNVNSGAFDPFIPLCQAARRVGAWVHVDGAFGLWARACEATQALTDGVDLADSWSVDAHKTLNSPYDCGLIICRDRRALAAALQANDAYLHFGEGRDGMLYTPDMSRRARSIEVWAALKSLGRAGVAALVAQLCGRARQFADELGAQGFRILNDVVFNQTLVACAAPALTQRTLDYVQKSGECWCSGTMWRGEPAIRVSVCSWKTSGGDVRRSVAAFVAARERAESLNT